MPDGTDWLLLEFQDEARFDFVIARDAECIELSQAAVEAVLAPVARATGLEIVPSVLAS